MKRIKWALGLLLISATAFSQSYKAPPTSSTNGYVPVISDELMEQCVRTYNEAEWLAQEINNTPVNQYDSYSVNSYNEKVNQHRQMTNWFNQNCAGKQSYSACKTANELNRQNGLPESPCQ